MPVTPTYPGVYIEELPSGVRTITGVATSVTAFVGYFKKGPMDDAQQLFNMGDFDRIFGGLDTRSEASYAIQQFFLNGGGEAWVVRTAKKDTAKKAAIKLKDSADGGADVLVATAASEGEWGNNVRIDVDYGTDTPGETFNMVVTAYAPAGGGLQPVATETFRNLTVKSGEPNSAADVVNSDSKLITIKLDGTPTKAPAQTGTVSKKLEPSGGKSAIEALGLAAGDDMHVLLNGTDLGSVKLDDSPPNTLNSLAGVLQAKIRALGGDLKKVTVALVGGAATGAYIRVRSGGEKADDVLSFTGTLAGKLGLDDAATTNVRQYALGGDAKAAQALPNSAAQRGADGETPDGEALIGKEVGDEVTVNTPGGLREYEIVDII